MVKREYYLMRSLINTGLKRCVLFFVLLLSIFGVVGSVWLPNWILSRLESMLSNELHRNVSIKKIELNPFTLQAILHDGKINDGKITFAKFKSLTLDVEWSSLWRRAPIFNEITLLEPQLNIVRINDHQYNFSDLFVKNNKNENWPDFSLNNIRVIKGLINFDDKLLHTQQILSDFQLALPFISTLEYRVDEYIQPSVSGKINGASFNIAATSKPFTRQKETRLSFSLDKLDVNKYVNYIVLPNELRLLSTQVSGKINIVFNMEKNNSKLVFEGPLQFDNVNIEQAKKPFVKINKLTLKLKDFEPLAAKYRFSGIKIDTLDMALEKALQLVNQSATPPKSQAKMLLDVGHFQLINSRVTYQDLVFDAIKFDVHGFVNKGNKTLPVRLAVNSPYGEQLLADLSIQTQPFSLTGKINASKLKLTQYSQYLAPYFKGEISDGLLDFETTAYLSINPLVYNLKNTEIGLSNLVLQQTKKPVLKVNQLVIKSLELDSAHKFIKATTLESKQGQLVAQILVNGQLNLATLMPESAIAAKPATPWRVQVEKIDINDWKLNLADKRLAYAPTIFIRDIALGFDHFDSQQGSKGILNLTGKWGNKGLVNIAGDVVPLPFTSKVAIDMRNVDAAFLQPYFTKYINVFLARGFLSAKGDLQVATEPKLNGRYRGLLSVDNFYALDKQTSTAFLKWNKLGFNGVNINLSPLRVDIAELALDKFYSRLILSATGRLNLQDILVHDGKQVSVADTQQASSVAVVVPEEVEKSVLPINIKKILFSNGNIRYSDNFIKPNFSANITGMTGMVNGLSSSENTLAQLDLHGFVDKIAPVKVSGLFNTLAKKMFLDIKGGVNNYDLTSASTYSSKYAGYGVEKGKLSMDVSYKVENNKLLANNKLFLDQFVLSDEKITNETATTLPVKLALSLLTDRRGQINLNLPIEGSLDDPEFSVSGIILQVIANLMEKIVTAPFDVLASSFGGESITLSHITFNDGSETLDATAEKSIKKLAEVLQDRPGLKLDIQSYLDPIVDRQTLKKRILQRKVLGFKLEKLAGTTQSLEDDSQLAMSKDEYPYLLEQAYKKEDFKRPTNLIGFDKTLSVVEMEKLIMEHIEIKDDDLHALGLRRALRVKSALLAAGVEEARMFVVQAKINNSQDKPSRVQFDLK
jgi:outer membrane protein OmpA-like peptidoglycan-associated protein